MSGHHPAHTRLPMGNPPPVEHSLGGWNHIGHQAPGVGILPGPLNQHPNLMGNTRNMVPQTAHLGPAIPIHTTHTPHPAWINKVPGGSHNGDGTGLPPNPSTNQPPNNQLFMQLLANQDRDRRVAAAVAGYRGTSPYQQDMIDLSRPASERTEPLPLVTGSPSVSGEKESSADVHNGSATSESASSVNGEVSSEKRVPATVSVIAANPSREKSVEPKLGRAEGTLHSVWPTGGNPGDLSGKTDSDKSKAPSGHLKVAPTPVQTLVSHNKKFKSVEAIVENLFELGSKKQEDSTTALAGNLSPSQNSYKPFSAQTVPKTDDPHSESDDSDGKMRRKRKIDTPTRKSMSPPPVKKALLQEQAVQLIAAKFETSQESKPSQPTVLSEPPTVPTVSTNVGEPTTSAPVQGSGESNTVKSEGSTSEAVPSASQPAPATGQPVKEEEDPLAEMAAIIQQPLVSSSPADPCVSSTPVDAPKDDVKNAFVEVESKMEALFAGIIGSGDEATTGPNETFGEDMSNPLTPFNESLDLDTTSNIAAVLEAKPSSAKKGRPKGSRNGIRQSSDSIFGTSSTESSPQKGKKQKSKEIIALDSPGKKGKKANAAIFVGKNKAKFQKEPSQQTCDSGSTASSVRIKGPVVHCVGPRDSPHHVSIINAPAREDEDQEKVKRFPTGRRKGAQIEGKVTSTGLCNSSLVSRSEAHSPENRTWVCVFCKRGPHLNGAGDLFGPYLIGESETTADLDISEKKKSKHTSFSPPGSQGGMLTVQPCVGDSAHFIAWTHEDCVLWASGVHLVGARLAGLDDAVWAALNTKCHRCRNWGASIGCIRHGCGQRAHYQCGLESGWHLDEESFKSTCNLHRV